MGIGIHIIAHGPSVRTLFVSVSVPGYDEIAKKCSGPAWASVKI